jgi:carbon monoxide dehydrogenase subunit G
MDVRGRFSLDCAQSLVAVSVKVPDLTPDFGHTGFEFTAGDRGTVGVLYSSAKGQGLRLDISDRLTAAGIGDQEIASVGEVTAFAPEGKGAAKAYWGIKGQVYTLSTELEGEVLRDVVVRLIQELATAD